MWFGGLSHKLMLPQWPELRPWQPAGVYWLPPRQTFRPVRGVAVWRVIENTYEGRRLYVDDLVTDTAHRSRGIGKTLLGHLERRAQEMQCDVLALDSGTQRTEAHRFYFREGLVIPAFSFRKDLK